MDKFDFKQMGLEPGKLLKFSVVEYLYTISAEKEEELSQQEAVKMTPTILPSGDTIMVLEEPKIINLNEGLETAIDCKVLYKQSIYYLTIFGDNVEEYKEDVIIVN